MTISRRDALTWASALALTEGLAPRSARAAPLRPGNNGRAVQSFLELLIHRDEDRHQPHTALISIPAPDTAWYAVDTLDEAAYANQNRSNKKHGFRLKRASAFNTRAGLRYAAIWEKAAGPDWHSRHGMGRSDFESACYDFGRKGFRLVHVDARQTYLAIWEKQAAGSQRWFSALTPRDCETQFSTLGAQGLRPTRLSLSASGGSPSLAAVFDGDSGQPWFADPLMNASDFAKTGAQLKSQGYLLTDASGFMIHGKPHFSGIWEKI